MKRVLRALGLALLVAVLVPSVVSAYWPVASRYSYVSQWYSRYHRADDLYAASGTRVVPVRSGTTVFAGYKSNCGGYQVWVSHGNGLYTAYYHLSHIYTYRGEYVTGGSETIGAVGRSGCATGSHLHVEVWHGYPWHSGSYRVNPWGYIDYGYYLPYRYR